jgi:hypothetical protein
VKQQRARHGTQRQWHSGYGTSVED